MTELLTLTGGAMGGSAAAGGLAILLFVAALAHRAGAQRGRD
jgi:hypothetical protein